MRLRQSEFHSLLEKIKTLQSEGLSYRQIENRLGVDKSKISRMLNSSTNQQVETQIPNDFVSFNQLIGLPLHPKTKQATQVYDYQIELCNLIDKHSWILVNKARKIGISELVLRKIAYESFHRYAKGQILIVSGNRIQQSRRLMRRMQRLFTNIEDHVESKTSDSLILRDGTEILAMPATETSVRGLENVTCIFLDEACWFNVLSDVDTYTALEPLLISSQGDFIIISTPNSNHKGFFYDLWHLPEDQCNFYRHTMHYSLSLNKLLDQKAIDRAMKDTIRPFSQEYENSWVSNSNAIITDDLLKHSEEDFETIDISYDTIMRGA